MADPLFELLAPYFDTPTSPRSVPKAQDKTTTKYLNRLLTLPLAALTSSEPQSLAQSFHSTQISLQSLSARSNSSIVASSKHLSNLEQSLPALAVNAESLQNDIPKLDEQTMAFSARYSRIASNDVLDRRKRALLMARNVDRLSDILDLPILLSSAISSSTAQGASGGTNYSLALDLFSHIKRLHLLYQDSELISSIYKQTEVAMQDMTTNLITSLRSQNIKLAAAMRTVGWLRRVAPELDGNSHNKEGILGPLFLACRLGTLVSLLTALDPLRDLADQETVIRLRDDGMGKKPNTDAWSLGQQTERYLKRYIEIFREHSFAIMAMHKSIFPSDTESTASVDLELKFKSLGLRSFSTLPQASTKDDPLSPIPSTISTFAMHLVSLLTTTLKTYLPNVRDKASRESLLTQVLYCASSLGRMGGDFSLLLADLGQEDESDEDEDDTKEWVELMKKHRVLAGRLETLAGSGSIRGTKGSMDGLKSPK